MGRIGAAGPVELSRGQAVPERLGQAGRLRLTPSLVALAILLGACGGRSGGAASDRPRPCPEPTGRANEALLPKDLDLGEHFDVHSAMVVDAYLTVTGTADTSVVELDPELQRSLIDAGYVIIGHDNEGFEAEVFFQRGDDVLGTIQLREAACDEKVVNVRFLLTSPRYQNR